MSTLPTHPPLPSAGWRMLALGSRPPKLPKGLDAVAEAVVAVAQDLVPRQRRLLKRAAGIVDQAREYVDWTDAKLRDHLARTHELFRRGRDGHADLDAALAVLCEVAFRQVGLRPFREQIAAALAMQQGLIAEMATGEGKTLVGAICGAVAGWRGKGCHVVTVNDYLVRRDAEIMGPIYRAAGLRVGFVQGGMDPAARRHAYEADVTYVTNKEVTADFLRDRLVLGQTSSLAPALLAKIAEGVAPRVDQTVMRGLEYAIIDEADSLLVDEAVTPLIISGDAPNAEQVESFQQAAKIAAELRQGRDYTVNLRFRDVDLTRLGRTAVSELAAPLGGIWTGARRREELVVQALTARDLFLRDKHYVIQEGKIVIVDEFTGRLMPDRTWRDGLHQAIEAKEQLTVQPPKATLARISFQRFFRMYRRLAGMTGTAWEVRREMWRVYRLAVVRIPTHKPCVRVLEPTHVVTTTPQRWSALVEQIKDRHLQGLPVLIGTRSVQASEHLSQLLTNAKLEHVVLNAVRQEQEAAIVAAAGNQARITVATNMAGRGTDIKLGRGVADIGGLHVIATERHESGRIDRQLFGRAARQGDPGSAAAFVSLEDELIRRYLPKPLVQLLAWTLTRPSKPADILARAIINYAQHRSSSLAYRQRQSVLKTDDWLDQALGFAGFEP
ncbi:MAG: hypothetical protein IT442_02970 [Phycisphaeraceae bacterium]|nr:hypothetical protein [Phycisphaeraceae bacterium]